MRDALNKPVGRSNDNAKYVGLSSLDKYGKNKIDKKKYCCVMCVCPKSGDASKLSITHGDD